MTTVYKLAKPPRRPRVRVPVRRVVTVAVVAPVAALLISAAVHTPAYVAQPPSWRPVPALSAHAGGSSSAAKAAKSHTLARMAARHVARHLVPHPYYWGRFGGARRIFR